MKTQEQIEAAAEQYAEEMNSCYTNDYSGFVSGAQWYAESTPSLESFIQRARELGTFDTHIGEALCIDDLRTLYNEFVK